MNKLFYTITTQLIVFLLPAIIFAQPGNPDTTFNPGVGANSLVWTTSIQPDGKVIIGGNFTTYNGTSRNRIARLNTDGSLDGTFIPGAGANSSVRTIAIQPDGKIIIGGEFTTFGGMSRNRIARLNTDGSLDGTFIPGAGANNIVYTAAIQPNDKIIIGGNFNTYNGSSRNWIARLNSDGSLDGTFNPVSGNGTVWSSIIQPDGKIIIIGSFSNFNGTARNGVARLETDGSLDYTFFPGTGANNALYACAIQPDGKIIIGGVFTEYNGTARNRVARLNTNGSLDGTFNPGTGANNIIYTASIQPDGKIIIGGYFTDYNGTARSQVARLNTNGSLDGTFYHGSGANNGLLTSAIQPDGKIIIGGDFTNYNGTGRNRVARVLASFDGAALNFGVYDFVNLGNMLGNFGTADFTIELSVKTSLNHTYFLSKRAVCNVGDYWNLKMENGKAYFEIMQNSASAFQILAGTTIIKDGLWHRLAVTRKNNLLTLYVDGAPEASGTFNGNPNSNASLIIGTNVCNGVNGSIPFAGTIDELRIWNIVRNQDMLLRSSQCELSGNPPGLIAHYRFNQGTDIGNNNGVISLTDATGTYNGTLYNFSLNGTVSNWVAPGAVETNNFCPIYEFSGNGNFSVPANWVAGVVPPNPLTAGSFIFINPQASGQCLLDIPFTGDLGSAIRVAEGKSFVIPGNVIIY